MPLSMPLMRLRRRGSGLWILPCAGAVLPQLSLRALRLLHRSHGSHDWSETSQHTPHRLVDHLSATALGSAGILPATRSAMSRSLRLLSLNVNGLRSADKRRTLFSLLHRDRWDVVLLQETHHTDDAEAQAWTQEGQT